MTTSRVPVVEGAFKPRAWAGDIFVDTATYNAAFDKKLPVKKPRKGYPKVLAVVTPACDLIPGRAVENPLQTVTMIGGDLSPLSDTHGPSTNLIMLNGKPYAVTWNPKWPMTSSVAAMSTNSAFSGRYQWIGRLRELYHAELQHKLFSDVGRVGLPTPPTMPEYVPVRILVKTGRGSGKYETFRDYDGNAHAAWSFGSKKAQRDFCLREDLAWDLKTWVQGLKGAIDDNAHAKLTKWTSTPAWLDELQHPVSFKNTAEKSSTANGVTYRRMDKPFSADGDGDQSAFVVVFGRSPEGAQSLTPPAPPLAKKAAA